MPRIAATASRSRSGRKRSRIARAGDAPPAPNSASGVLIESSYFGDISVYKVKLDGPGTMRIAATNITRADAPVAKPGERVTLSWGADAGMVLTQ